MTRIMVACHGEPEKIEGEAQANWPLSRYGRNQSEYLTDKLLEFAPLNVICGPSLRSKQTGEIAAKRLGKGLRVDPRLGEIPRPAGVNFEDWLAATFRVDNATVWNQLDTISNKWRNDNLQAIREIKEPSLVVTQYVNINVIFGAALHVEGTAVCKPNYASITEFSVVNGDIRLVIEGKEVVGPNE